MVTGCLFQVLADLETKICVYIAKFKSNFSKPERANAFLGLSPKIKHTLAFLANNLGI